MRFLLWRIFQPAPWPGSALALAAAMRRPAMLVLVALAIAATADATAEQPAWRASAIDAATAERILALVPESISERDVRDVLTHAPAPRIIDLQGSLPAISMAPFAEFLIAMGYPSQRLRNPDGSLSYSSYVDARQLAGTMAWYYEQEGMMPMLIGHSQGGMVAIRVLHELAGSFGDSLPVWNPQRGAAESRSAIIDPLSGEQRAVVGLKVPYVAALATGALPRFLLGQWSMLTRLHEIPDTVDEFTGFSLEWDLIAGNFGSITPYRATGTARVRNVTLPAAASHLTLPQAQQLALDPLTRQWIDSYVPGTALPALPAGTGLEAANLLHAADIWYSVKEHWCLEAQRLIRSRRSREVPLQ